MEPQEKTASPHQWRRTTTSGPEEDHSRSRRSNGWAECREKNIGIEPMENTFLLTFLLIGHCYSRPSSQPAPQFPSCMSLISRAFVADGICGIHRTGLLHPIWLTRVTAEADLGAGNLPVTRQDLSGTTIGSL